MNYYSIVLIALFIVSFCDQGYLDIIKKKNKTPSRLQDNEED
jgi:hypothetical protein